MGLKINGNNSSISTSEAWTATEMESVSFANVPAPSSDTVYREINASASGVSTREGFRDLRYYGGELSENAIMSDDFELINGKYVYIGDKNWIAELVINFDRQDGVFSLDKISLVLDNVTNRESLTFCSSTYSPAHVTCNISVYAQRNSRERSAGIYFSSSQDSTSLESLEIAINDSIWDIYYEEADFSSKVEVVGKLDVSSDLKVSGALNVTSDLHVSGHIYVEEL